MKLDEMALSKRPKFMNLNDICVFIPVFDTELYAEWDEEVGYGQMDQIMLDDGIVVQKKRAEQFRQHVAQFEAKYSSHRD